jgi:hypothetical protein
MILDYLAAIVLWLSMIAYAVLGGADFGGLWDLFSLGAQAEEKRCGTVAVGFLKGRFRLDRSLTHFRHDASSRLSKNSV